MCKESLPLVYAFSVVGLIFMYQFFYTFDLVCSYVLGAVFLQLCKVLRLEEHPIVQKPVDPSLFIDKFTQCEYFMSLVLQV